MSSGRILDKKTQTTDMSTRAVFMLGQPDTSSNIKGIKMKWWERRMDVSQWRWSACYGLVVLSSIIHVDMSPFDLLSSELFQIPGVSYYLSS